MESCHAGAEVKLLLYSCKLFMVNELSGGHLGRDKTIEKIMSRFFWKDMNSGYENLLNAATSAKEQMLATFKKSNATLHSIPVHGQVWHTASYINYCLLIVSGLHWIII